MNAPNVRIVDQYTGGIADQSAEIARLQDENCELRCRVDELVGERNEFKPQAQAERRYAVRLADERDAARVERDTARAELAARS